MAQEGADIYMCIADSLCYTVETEHCNYTPIVNLIFKKDICEYESYPKFHNDISLLCRNYENCEGYSLHETSCLQKSIRFFFQTSERY